MSGNVVALKAGGAITGIVPQSIEEVFRLATAVAKSGMAPNGMNTAEKLSVAIMHGMEIGLPPMQAIQRIAVVNGRPTIWGDAVPALLWSKGFKLDERMEGGGDERVAWCVVHRPDGDRVPRSFSVADAKTAGLWGKVGPWKQYPDRMLQMRARGFAARDGAADVLMGLYLREEVEDDEATAPKSAYRAKKDGDYEKIIEALRACATSEDIDAALANNSETLDKLPRKWHEHIDEHVAAARARVSAVTVEAVEEDEPDATASAKQMIAQAISLDHLARVRDVFDSADWNELEPIYDEKARELGAA